MSLFTLLLWPVVALFILCALAYVQFYWSIIMYARQLKKCGWLVIVRYRVMFIELDAIHPDNPESYQHAKLYVQIGKDKYDGC